MLRNSVVDTVAPVTITKRPVKRVRTPREAVRATDGVDRMGERRTQRTGLFMARIHGPRVASACIGGVTRKGWQSPRQDPTNTVAPLQSNNHGPIGRHRGTDRDE